MDTSFLWQAAWWLLEWAGIIGLSGLALLVVCRVVAEVAAQTWHKMAYDLADIRMDLVDRASESLSVCLIVGIRITVFLLGLVIRALFWPARVVVRLLATKRPKQEAPKPPPPQSGDPLKEARDILGLHNGFSAADLKERHRELMKRVHTDLGGTDWLAQRVNWAHDILKNAAAR
jgi:hypothetical protein